MKLSYNKRRALRSFLGLGTNHPISFTVVNAVLHTSTLFGALCLYAYTLNGVAVLLCAALCSIVEYRIRSVYFLTHA